MEPREAIPEPLPVRRAFVQVGARTVHYRRLGSGPPVVLVHGSPASSAILESEMRLLAPDFTCFAFDTPGFGDSDALAQLPEGIGTLADALAETLAALRFPGCPVFGTHTGAAIALELGLRHPDRVTGIVLDGLPMYTEAEQRELFGGYFEPLEPDALGGHFAHNWTRFRDLFMWFPWNRRTPQTLNETDGPAAQRLELWVSMFYRAARSYAPAYKAAIAYGSRARDAVAALRVPAVFMAHEHDMLFPHLERLPPLATGQSLLRIRREAHAATLSAAVRGCASRQSAPADPPPRFLPGAMLRQFHDLAHGQVLVRTCGAPSAASPTILLLHDTPGSGQSLEALALRLSAGANVVLADLPGCGESPGFGGTPTLLHFADAMLTVLDELGVERAIVHGRGFGASLAVQLCLQAPSRTAALVLDSPALPDPVLRERMLQLQAPRIVVEADGSHWYRTWLMLRDALVYFPWFERTRAALRRVPADFDAWRLHDLTFEVLKQAPTWHELTCAALAQDPSSQLRELRTRRPAPRILGVEDPLHPFAAFAPALQAALAAAPLPATSDGALAALLLGLTRE